MKQSKRAMISWSLYDWANSAFATTVMAAFFPIFFSSYWSLGQDSETTTFFLGMANSVESLIVAVLAPMLGAIADSGSYRKKFLIFFAFLGSIMTGALYLVAAGHWVQAMAFYVLANIGFAGANIFYDALLPGVAGHDKLDFVSALGYGMGYIGGGLLFLLNVLMVLFPAAFGLADTVQAVRVSFLMVAIWWIVFSLPLFFFVKDDAPSKGLGVKAAVKKGFSDVVHTVKSLRKLKMTALFLVAFWCYIDGVDTIIRMAVDYGTSLGFPAESLVIALLITQFVAFPAALAYNWFGHKVGLKRQLVRSQGRSQACDNDRDLRLCPDLLHGLLHDQCHPVLCPGCDDRALPGWDTGALAFLLCPLHTSRAGGPVLRLLQHAWQVRRDHRTPACRCRDTFHLFPPRRHTFAGCPFRRWCYITS